MVALAALPVVVALLPFVVVGAGRRADSFGRQLGRPLQIESLGAGVLLAPHHVFGTRALLVVGERVAEPERRGRGRRRRAPGRRPGGRGRRRLDPVRPRPGRPARGSSATAPRPSSRSSPSARCSRPSSSSGSLLLVPLVGGVRGRAALVLTLLACALTAGWFPARYWELVREFDPLASWLVLLRGLDARRPPRGAHGRPGNTDRLDRARPPRRRIAGDERALEARAAGRRLEPDGQARPHPPDRELGCDADHGVVRARHPGVGDRSRPTGQDAARRTSARACACRARR